MSYQRNERHCRSLIGALAVAFLVAPGCGGKRTFPVEGKVLWEDGTVAKELHLGTVAFEMVAEGAPVRLTAYGLIDEEGTYRLTTYEPGDGALPGNYRVIIANRAYPRSLEHEMPPVPPLDPRFSSYDTANINVIVEAKKNDIPLHVKRNKTENRPKLKPASS